MFFPKRREEKTCLFHGKFLQNFNDFDIINLFRAGIVGRKEATARAALTEHAQPRGGVAFFRRKGMLKVVKTENGLVRGLPGNNTRISVFKGIPFAAPPVGKNRWRAPQPAADWEGIRDCYTFGPISMQDTPGLGSTCHSLQ